MRSTEAMMNEKLAHDAGSGAQSYVDLMRATGEGFWLAALETQAFYASTECLAMLEFVLPIDIVGQHFGKSEPHRTGDTANAPQAARNAVDTHDTQIVRRGQFTHSATSIPVAVQRVLQCTHPMDVATAVAGYRELLTSHAPITIELRLRAEHGQFRWFAVRAVKVCDADGTLVEVLGSLRDIHQDRFLQQTHRALYAISEATHSDADFGKLLETIHGTIAELLPAKNLFVALYEPETDMVSFPYFFDEFDSAPVPRKLADRGLTQRVIRNGKPVLMTPEMRAERVARGEQIVGAVCLDWLGVPLLNAGTVIGALVIQSYSGDVRYSQRDLELLQFVSNQVASTIVRKQNQVHIERLAHTDALTGVANRSLLDDRLAHALEKAKRNKTLVAVLYLDLDGFKPVNDTFGHAVGDQLLVEIARRMKVSLRASDSLARIGGDEFVVVIEDCQGIDYAIKVGEKLLAQIALPWHPECSEVGIGCFTEAKQIGVSASLGIALSSLHGTGAHQLLKASDTALYRAKRAGKGCLVVA
jgi:diguanylate cyclase (GGDEF)-like protein